MSSMVITGSRFSNIGGAKNPVTQSKVGAAPGVDFAVLALRVRGGIVPESARVSRRVITCGPRALDLAIDG